MIDKFEWCKKLKFCPICKEELNKTDPLDFSHHPSKYCPTNHFYVSSNKVRDDRQYRFMFHFEKLFAGVIIGSNSHESKLFISVKGKDKKIIVRENFMKISHSSDLIESFVILQPRISEMEETLIFS